MIAERLLLDTPVLIWFVEGKLSPATLATIVDVGLRQPCLFSQVSAWEIGLLARPNRDGVARHAFDPDPMSWFRDLTKVPFFAEAALTSEILLASSFLPGDVHGDPADRMLIASARALDCTLLTHDAAILAYAAHGHVKAIAC